LLLTSLVAESGRTSVRPFFLSESRHGRRSTD
jgi:hypothetical protein